MKTICALLLMLSMGLLSCHIQEEPSLDNLFSKPIHIESSIFEIDSLMIGNPMYMDIMDSLMIVNNFFHTNNTDKKFFSLIDIKNKKLIKRFGLLGKGPNEFLLPLNVNFNPQERTIASFIPQSQSSISIKLDSLLNSKQNYTVEKVVLKAGILTNCIELNTQNYFASIGLFKNAKYRIIDKSGNLSFNFGNIDINPQQEEPDSMILGMVYQGKIKSHPAKNKFVYCSNANDLIEIIDLSKKDTPQIKRFQSYYPKYEVKNGKMGFNRDNKHGFQCVDATEKYIYCLYSGKSFNEDGSNLLQSKKIYVFDWNLNPVRAYHLDYDVTFIAISDNDKALYSTVLVEDDMKFAKWPMNH